MRFAGIFGGLEFNRLKGIADMPCVRLDGHVLCARDTQGDGGAVAYVQGAVHNKRALTEMIQDAGISIKEEKGIAGLILQAYRLWGTAYPARLEGPNATVVIDRDRQRMVLSVDRMGEQSIFYAANAGTVVFSDHPAPVIKNAPFLDRTVDRQGLCELFALGPARTPGITPVRGLKMMEPGTTLVCDQYSQRVYTYFTLEAHEHDDDLHYTIDSVRDMVENALAQTLTHRPHSMLSGGLDSTVLTALCARAMKGTVNTWSVEYEDDQVHFTQNDYQRERDTPFIRQAAAYLGTNHTQVRINQRALFDGLHDAMLARGLPGMADVDTSLMLFSKRIAIHSGYALSGECADEVFGGYPWFHRSELINRDGFPWSGALDLRGSILKPSVSTRLNLSQYAAQRYHECAAKQPRLASDSQEEAKLRLIHGLCLRYFMPVLQERARCMGQWSGLTVLTPYCDVRLVQYVYNIPWSIKNLGGQEKGLLRLAMKDLLPNSLINRKKSPYPKTHHPEYARLVVDEMNALLYNSQAPLNEIIDKTALYDLMNGDLRADAAPWFGQLMTGVQMIAYLIQVNDWLETYDLNIAI